MPQPILFKLLEKPVPIKGFAPLIPNTQPQHFGCVFDAPDSGGLFNFSADLLGVTRPSSLGINQSARATNSSSSGYFEISITSIEGNCTVGVTSAIQSGNDWIGDSQGVGWTSFGTVFRASSGIATYNTFSAPVVISVYIKNGFLYFAQNGIWENSANPSAGTGGIDISSYPDTSYPGVSSSGGVALTGNFGASAFAYPIPSGGNSWDGSQAASGGTPVTGTAAATEASDTAAASGAVTITGAAASTEAADTSASSGAVTVTGTEAATETNDTAVIAGAATVSGTEAATEGSDSASATGSVTVSGTVSRTEAADTASSAGTLSVAGSGAPTEAADTSSASGTITALGSTSGSVAATEANDNTAASGSSSVAGSIALAESADTVAGTGSTSWPALSGSAAIAEAADTASATAAAPVSGSAAAAEAADGATGSGGVVILGTFAANDNGDTCAALGDIESHAPRQYPLAGVEQPYPGAAPTYPLTGTQDYPLDAAQTYPLADVPQQYPLAS